MSEQKIAALISLTREELEARVWIAETERSWHVEAHRELHAEVARLREALENISWLSVVMPDGSVNTTASYAARAALAAPTDMLWAKAVGRLEGTDA